MRDLAGKVAVVTGAASGFGRELAICCAGEGMQVVLADIDLEGARATGALLPGASWIARHSDVSDAADVEGLARATFDRFGSAHVLFNNAGVMTLGSVWAAPLQDWTWVMGVNVMGVVHGIRAFVPRMLAQGGEAHVVNTASLAGLVSPPTMGVYAASKHAVVAISESLYHDLQAAQARIGVSVLCPAFVATGIADAGRNRPAELSADNDPEAGPMIEWLRGALHAGRLTAADVARVTLDAVKENRFYILPHRRAKDSIRRRFDDIIEGRLPGNPLAAP